MQLFPKQFLKDLVETFFSVPAKNLFSLSDSLDVIPITRIFWPFPPSCNVSHTPNELRWFLLSRFQISHKALSFLIFLLISRVHQFTSQMPFWRCSSGLQTHFVHYSTAQILLDTIFQRPYEISPLLNEYHWYLYLEECQSKLKYAESLHSLTDFLTNLWILSVC